MMQFVLRKYIKRPARAFLKTAEACLQAHVAKELSKKGHRSMKEQNNMQEKDLKAFLATYVIDAQENDIKSVAIVAFTKEEAGNLFIRWIKSKGLYERITAIVVQRTKKTKANKHMFAIDFYEKQNAFISYLERKADA